MATSSSDRWTDRDSFVATVIPALHDLKVQIPGLKRDCACYLVAEVVADAVLGKEASDGTG